MNGGHILKGCEMLYTLILAWIFFLTGCSSNRTDAKRADTVKSRQILQEKECDLMYRYPESIKEMTERPQWVGGIHMDSCFFVIVDTLVSDYLRTGDTQYIACLDAIGAESDGFVGEYMAVAAIKTYMQRPVDLVKYMYAHNQHGGKGMEEALIRGLHVEIYWPASAHLTKEEIDSVTAAASGSELMSAKERLYLVWLDKQWKAKDENQ